MPVMRLKNFEKKAGLGKLRLSASCATVISLCLKATFASLMSARSIHSLAVVPLACLTRVPR